MDAGRPEAFLWLFQVIEDHDLIRYSSVKRAVSTWIGIFDENHVDRISNKLLNLMGRCLKEPDFCQEQLHTNDSISISCALWAKGFYDAQDGINAVLELVQNGTRNQKLTASYFNSSLQDKSLSAQAAKKVLLDYPDDLELMACFMPGFMKNTSSVISELLHNNRNGWFSARSDDAQKPDNLPVTAYGLFCDKEEAKKFYEILKHALETIPKKGFERNPCIFSWYRVTMSRSDLAVRMCLIAWMLQEESYLDEAAKLIPFIGQGETYGTSRAMTARLLLYKPESSVRRNVLLELLHNPEEYTLSSAFCLAKVLDLKPEDYLLIEKNLKYKKGRTENLSLLRRQKPSELRASIIRLLDEKPEECHMGAFDLALGMKKDAPEEFEPLRDVLLAFENPTGKERVLLTELTEGSSKTQDILSKPGYGLYDTTKEFVVPKPITDLAKAPNLFHYGEKECIRILKALNEFIEAHQFLEYTTVWGEETTLGAELARTCWQDGTLQRNPLDEYPFRALWEEFYQNEIKSTQMLLELYLYEECRQRREEYGKIPAFINRCLEKAF